MKKIMANGNTPLTELELVERQEKLEKVFGEFLDILGYDRENDHNIKGTPKRMAKMYNRELLIGNYAEPPAVTTFPNFKEYDEMIISGPIKIKSLCSHHLVPISGEAWIGYIPGDTVVGLSKLARIAQYYMRRPQIQEEMTEQIVDHIEELLNPKGIMVVVKASHMCMTIRGAEEENSLMVTSSVRGAFASNPETRQEFLTLIRKGN